ncbi:MAG: hypothetical protein ACRDIX_04300 [Actinomycetota bacterium]
MCWPTHDLDYARMKLQEDFRATRERGKVPRRVRFGAWVSIIALSVLTGVPALALPVIVLFEAFVAPRLARPPSREMGPLREWRPPEGMTSPEALPTSWAGRDLKS